MRRLDIDKMVTIAQEIYVTEVARAFGSPGVEALREILSAIRKLYGYVEPELISGSLIVFRSLGGGSIEGAAQTFAELDHLAQEYDAPTRAGMTALEILPNGDLRLWKEADVDVQPLSESAIVYVYANAQERFIIRGVERPVINPNPVHVSIFAIPTFRELDDALENYKRRSILKSQCQIFTGAWEGGVTGDRLFFRSGPEVFMRRSLTQYLQNVLRGAEVRPEQIVDESHPVDIKVTWMFTNRIALIEIKWIGRSLNEKGNIVSYADARANQGAKQLADYLDANATQTPMHVTIGYLIVIDGRRRGLDPSSTSVNYEDGMWYKDREITYNPDYHATRNDFAKPIRMFAEPICRPD